MLNLLVASLLTLPAVQQFDTTVSVRPGARLELNNFEGSVTVTTWSKNAVRVEANPEDREDIEVELRGNVVTVHADGRDGPPSVDYRLTVPADISLEVDGHSGDVTIDGTRGEISVETVEGVISVNGGNGLISLRSVDGDLKLSNAKGRIELNSVDGSLTLSNIVGEIQAQSVDGEITMDGIESSGVEAQSVDGQITYRGTIKEGGRYRLSSHDGGVTVITPEINATVSISTFSGDMETDFPCTLTGTRPGKRVNCTMGNGSARVDIESFDGTVELRKASKKP